MPRTHPPYPAEFRAEAEESLERQAQLETGNAESFETYLARYFAK